MQQVRLFPYLAAAFVHHHFSRDFFNDFFKFLRAGLAKEDPGIIQSIFFPSTFALLKTDVTRLH